MSQVEETIMQACIYEEYGPAEVVRLAEVAKPVLRDDQVLVRVHASSVTTADFRLRSSTFPSIFWLPGRLWLGLIRPKNPVLGMDFSGVVEAVGAQVTRLRVGDQVFGATSAGGRGAHAEYLAVEESGAIVHKPPSLSHEQAAAIPFGGNCALAFLSDFTKVRAGQRVLILGGSGGVGVWAVQLARTLGAHVTAVCSASNADLVRALGAHEVLDYTTQSFLDSGETYDVIFDTVGATTFAECKRALSAQGVLLPLNNDWREMLQALVTSFGGGKRLKFAVSQNTREGLEALTALIEKGDVKPVIDRVYAMAEIVEAHRHVESRHRRGSVIVVMPAQSVPSTAA
jgi:NADPH:quinone reductase-like Zn-dependent oxidoreductase